MSDVRTCAFADSNLLSGHALRLFCPLLAFGCVFATHCFLGLGRDIDDQQRAQMARAVYAVSRNVQDMGHRPRPGNGTKQIRNGGESSGEPSQSASDSAHAMQKKRRSEDSHVEHASATRRFYL